MGGAGVIVSHNFVHSFLSFVFLRRMFCNVCVPFFSQPRAHSTLKFTIEGKKDVQGGRRLEDARAAANSTHNTAFTRYLLDF